MKYRKHLALVAVLAFFGLTGFAPATPSTPTTGGTALQQLKAKLAVTHSEIPQAAIGRAFDYADSHSIANKDYITVIDFNKPSTAERMYVIHTGNGQVDSYLVAHGVNSGDNYATKFSNASGSLESSLGIYVTGSEYQGAHGRSMILKGKESTNSNAESRAIVLHSADYVSQAFIKANGRLGRSDGCTAVEVQYHDEIVKELEDGSVMIAYHN